MAYKTPKMALADMQGCYVGSTPARRWYDGGTLVYQGFSPASEQEFIQQEATGGPAQLLKVYGKSVVNNQMVKNGDFSTSDLFWNNQGYNSLLSIANGYLVVEATRTAGVWIHYRERELVGGHKYLFLLSVYSAVSCDLTLRLTYSGSNIVNYSLGAITTASAQKALIADMPADPFDFSLYTTGNINIGDKFYFDYIFEIDLTLLYGEGHEPTSVAQFLADYPTYNPTYDPGSLQSNKTAELRAERIPVINVWDEEWEPGSINYTTGQETSPAGYFRSKSYIPVSPGDTLYITNPNAANISFYDENKIFFNTGMSYINKRNTTFIVPNNAAFLRFATAGTTYNHDICINLSDPAINGQYFSHWRSSLALNLSTLTGKLNGEGASVVVFPDGLRGVGTDRDKAYGSTGEVARAVVDLGTLNWAKNSDPRGTYFWARIPNAKAVAGYLVAPNAICANYQVVSGANRANKTICQYNPDTSDEWMIYDSVYDSADAATFKAAMSGVMLDYPLATPLTYTLDTPLPTDLTCEQGDILQRVSDNNCPFVGEMKFGL